MENDYITMNNYQLYRTNIGLSGQLQWDLIVSGNGKNLHVSEFHLSPISHNVPFVYNQNDNLLNQSHLDNVKNFYNSTTGYFYKDNLDAQFNNAYPIVSNIDSYSNIYDMGCKRSKRFGVYKKQFEFFCPLWIEKFDNELSFLITVKNFNNKKVMSTTKLSLSLNGIKQHDRFVDYLNTFISTIGLDKGDDELLDIDFKKNKATIKGLNVKNGIIKSKQLKLINRLTAIERPLMETDEILLKQFEENALICKQLFNFNLCFNMDDIMPKNILKMMYGKNVIISISAAIGNNELEKMDFYTNYEHIQSNLGNALDYLYDYKYVSLINKNKFCQNICHWGLCDNPGYIFNLYRGFDDAMYNKDKSTIPIRINKALGYTIAKSPYDKSTEIVYNSKNVGVILNRKCGKIKPMFSLDNLIYYKQQINPIHSIYSNINFQKFEPLYPSIGYCGIKQCVCDYENSLADINNGIEYTWFNDNKHIILATDIHKSGTFNLGDSIEDIVYDIISDYYNITDDKAISYIKGLYNYTNNWGYVSNKNIDNKTYNISLVLK